LAILIAAAACFATPAVADEEVPKGPSPLTVAPDRNGVNISTGKLDIGILTLSVPADSRLTFDKVQNARPVATGNITNNASDEYRSSSWSVSYGGSSSEAFKCVFDDVCRSVNGTGGIFYMPTQFVQAGTGAQWAFTLLQSRAPTGAHTSGESYYAQSVAYPDGETISYTYEQGFNPSGGFPSCIDPSQTSCQSYYRPTRISSTTGYYITISYRYTGTDVRVTDWQYPAQAAIYAPDGTLIRRLVYASDWSVTDYGNSVTNVGGRTYAGAGLGNGLADDVELASATVTMPGEASPMLTLNIQSGFNVIDTLVRDGVTWNYDYTNLHWVLLTSNAYLVWDGVSVTGPDGYHMSYTTTQSLLKGIANRVGSSTDALGRTTTYSYDTAGRVDQIVYPEQNSIDLLYAGNGQVLTKTTHAKPNSGLANIVESWDYNGKINECAGMPDPVLCYRPTSYTDGRGHVYNYSYNSRGQLTQELSPADASAVRRETDISYASSPAGLSRKTLMRLCGQTTTCATSAQSRTEYAYFASGNFANTRMPLTVTQKDEATAATRVTTYSYDPAGRPTVIDGPLAGTGDARYFQYDKFGRKIWEIGELAPNNLRLAKKFTYRDSDDKVTRVETGTVACTTGCDTASLTLTLQQQADTNYDSRRYPIREVTSKAPTTYTVTDRSFLDRGLAECSTVRMNLAALPAATAHGACALGTQGSDGPDRITKNSYDSLGQLTLVQKAYLTADQADYVTYTYTPNGRQEYVTDANGNRARFVYDGFDRLSQWQFPSKTTPGTVNTADFEQYGYDANGNRTSLRKRDASTLAYTYDNLDRMTLKVVPSRADLTPAQTRDVFYGYDVAGRQLFARFDAAAGPDGVTNTYNGFGDLLTSNLTMGTFNKTVTSAYDAAGRRTQVTHPDGQAFTYAYDNLSRLSGVYEGAGTTSPIDTFAYAANGLVSSRIEGSGASGVTYGWDDVNRLTSQSDSFSTPANNVAWSFGYNPASQIRTETRSNDAYASVAPANGTTAYAYDANGNLTFDGVKTYTYDIENRLVKAVAGGTTTNVVYDPLGRLFEYNQASNTRRFVTDGDAIIGEGDGNNGLAERFVHGSNAAADDPLVWYPTPWLGLVNRMWLHADHLGSIVAQTAPGSPGGNPTINRYDEYGVPAASNGGRFQYTGQVWIAELGLYYYKARFYSPSLGRFMQTDPVGYEGGVNLYGYVGGDPVNASDPLGLYECQDKTSCAVAAQGMKEIQEARDYYRSSEIGSRIPRAAGAADALDKILGSLGEKGEPGVTIRAQNTLGPVGERGHFDTQTNTINIYLRQIRDSGGRIGETLGHETQHYRQRNDAYSGRFAPEVRPMAIQWLIGRAPGGSITGGGWYNYISNRLLSPPYCPSTQRSNCTEAVDQAFELEGKKPF
jgi:RHS repeat-associated protein